jgi:uncharacterized protein YecT (DUF1311 family)
MHDMTRCRRRKATTAASAAIGLLQIGLLLIVLVPSTGSAEAAKPNPRDASAVQSCLKSPRGKELNGERCIGVVADPCLKQAKSTADSNACADREFAVWDAMLNETYRGLMEHLEDDQKTKAREMQRAWIESRNKTCAFYWDYYQGTIASPMSSYCALREAARRAMFLKFFLDESEGR